MGSQIHRWIVRTPSRFHSIDFRSQEVCRESQDFKGEGRRRSTALAGAPREAFVCLSAHVNWSHVRRRSPGRASWSVLTLGSNCTQPESKLAGVLPLQATARAGPCSKLRWRRLYHRGWRRERVRASGPCSKLPLRRFYHRGWQREQLAHLVDEVVIIGCMVIFFAAHGRSPSPRCTTS